MRKVIVAYTKHGSLYGLDSKSGRVIWQTMTGCDSQISTGNGNSNFLFLQRGGAHFGLDPVATLICSMKSNKAKVVKFNPMNGKLHPKSRQGLLYYMDTETPMKNYKCPKEFDKSSKLTNFLETYAFRS